MEVLLTSKENINMESPINSNRCSSDKKIKAVRNKLAKREHSDSICEVNAGKKQLLFSAEHKQVHSPPSLKCVTDEILCSNFQNSITSDVNSGYCSFVQEKKEILPILPLKESKLSIRDKEYHFPSKGEKKDPLYNESRGDSFVPTLQGQKYIHSDKLKNERNAEEKHTSTNVATSIYNTCISDNNDTISDIDSRDSSHFMLNDSKSVSNFSCDNKYNSTFCKNVKIVIERITVPQEELKETMEYYDKKSQPIVNKVSKNKDNKTSLLGMNSNARIILENCLRKKGDKSMMADDTSIYIIQNKATNSRLSGRGSSISTDIANRAHEINYVFGVGRV